MPLEKVGQGSPRSSQSHVAAINKQKEQQKKSLTELLVNQLTKSHKSDKVFSGCRAHNFSILRSNRLTKQKGWLEALNLT